MNNNYRKKPIEVKAIQWDGTNKTWNKIIELGLRNWKGGDMGSDSFYIETLDGYLKTNKGDYIIKNIKGEFYPCKPDIFNANYEKIEY